MEDVLLPFDFALSEAAVDVEEAEVEEETAFVSLTGLWVKKLKGPWSSCSLILIFFRPPLLVVALAAEEDEDELESSTTGSKLGSTLTFLGSVWSTTSSLFLLAHPLLELLPEGTPSSSTTPEVPAAGCCAEVPASQVWSLTQFYCVDFSKSRIGINT